MIAVDDLSKWKDAHKVFTNYNFENKKFVWFNEKLLDNTNPPLFHNFYEGNYGNNYINLDRSV